MIPVISLLNRSFTTSAFRESFYRLILVSVISCFALIGNAQITLEIHPQDDEASAFLASYNLPSSYSGLIDARSQLSTILSDARTRGHLASSIDSFHTDSTTLHAWLYLGSAYNWVEFIPNEMARTWMNEIGLNKLDWSGKHINPDQFDRLVSRLLTYGENHGYPFTSVYLDSIELNEKNGVVARLNLYESRFFTFDSIAIRGDAKISSKFLHQYLGFQPGQPYSEKLARKIDEKLAKLPYVTVVSESRISFVGDHVRVYTNLNHRKTDQVDGIVGFAPNTDNKLLITGEANIDLKNLLRRGIGYTLHWKSFQKQSQMLNMSGQLPYLLNSPVGVDAQFDYVKFDTQFFTLKTLLGIHYAFEGTDYLKFYVQNQQSALLFADTNDVRVTQSIPISNPVRTTSYGLQLVRQKLDVPRNPRKGFTIALDGSLGARNILKDVLIEQVKFTDGANNEYDVYDSVKLRTVQAELKYAFSWFVPVGKKSTIVSLVSGKHLFSETVFYNDLFRFGGTKSLRGFNEESLTANGYTIVGIEYRYLLGGNAFFQLFANAAYLEDRSDQMNGLRTDMPYGFGAGVNLEVNNGLLSLAYALGSEQGNPIRFSQAKIHFGIINFL